MTTGIDPYGNTWEFSLQEDGGDNYTKIFSKIGPNGIEALWAVSFSTSTKLITEYSVTSSKYTGNVLIYEYSITSDPTDNLGNGNSTISTNVPPTTYSATTYEEKSYPADFPGANGFHAAINELLETDYVSQSLVDYTDWKPASPTSVDDTSPGAVPIDEVVPTTPTTPSPSTGTKDDYGTIVSSITSGFLTSTPTTGGDCALLPTTVTSGTSLARNYTVGDLCINASFPGAQRGLSEQEIACNTIHLIENVIYPMTTKYSGTKGFVITSGIRAGSGTSQHEIGCAVDHAYPNSISIDERAKLTYDLAVWCANNLAFDQMLLEYRNHSQVWLHISYDKTSLRRQIKTFVNDKSKYSGLYLYKN